jgi:hypothetical protein
LHGFNIAERGKICNLSLALLKRLFSGSIRFMIDRITSENMEQNRLFESLKNNPEKLAAFLEKIGENHEVKVHFPNPELVDSFSVIEELVVGNSSMAKSVQVLLNFLKAPIITDNFVKDLERKKWRGKISFDSKITEIKAGEPEFSMLKNYVIGSLVHFFTENNKLRVSVLNHLLEHIELVQIKFNLQIINQERLNQLRVNLSDYSKMNLEHRLQLVEEFSSVISELLQAIKNKLKTNE